MKRILLVENDIVLAVLTKLELEDLGYEVLEIASTGSYSTVIDSTSSTGSALGGSADGTSAVPYAGGRLSP